MSFEISCGFQLPMLPLSSLLSLISWSCLGEPREKCLPCLAARWPHRKGSMTLRQHWSLGHIWFLTENPPCFLSELMQGWTTTISQSVWTPGVMNVCGKLAPMERSIYWNESYLKVAPVKSSAKCKYPLWECFFLLSQNNHISKHLQIHLKDIKSKWTAKSSPIVET